MKFRFIGTWSDLNMTPTVNASYDNIDNGLLTVRNVTIAGVSFSAGFVIFYSDKANAWILEAIKWAVNYVMGKVTDMSFEMFGDFWKTEQKKSSDKTITAYGKSVDGLNEVIKLEKNQRLNRTLTTYQTECRGIETAEQLKNAQYSANADSYNNRVTSRVTAMSSGMHRERAYEGLFTPSEAATFDADTAAYQQASPDDRVESSKELIKESLTTSISSSIKTDDPETLKEDLRFVAFLTMELDATLKKGLAVELGEDPSFQTKLAYGRLSTIASRNSVVKGIAAREVLNKYKKEHGGNGRNHSLQAMLDNTYYSEEWQQSIRTFVDPVPAAAEWIRVLGHRFELIRDEYRANEEALLILSTMILNRLDSPFTRDVVSKSIKLTRGKV